MQSIPPRAPPLDPEVLPALLDPAGMRAHLDDLHRQYDEARAAGRVLHLYPIRERLIVYEELYCTELSAAALGVV